MEEGTKKPIMVAIIVVCLGLAALIFYKTRSGTGGGIDSIPGTDMVWVMCNNPDCKTTYQTNKREYFKFIEANQRGGVEPAMTCEKCGKETVYRAVKCEKCGHVFYRGTVPNDYFDRCPECGFSFTEQKRKEVAESQRTK
jgi:uncharacterized OB-fold protein